MFKEANRHTCDVIKNSDGDPRLTATLAYLPIWHLSQCWWIIDVILIIEVILYLSKKEIFIVSNHLNQVLKAKSLLLHTINNSV